MSLDPSGIMQHWHNQCVKQILVCCQTFQNKQGPSCDPFVQGLSGLPPCKHNKIMFPPHRFANSYKLDSIKTEISRNTESNLTLYLNKIKCPASSQLIQLGQVTLRGKIRLAGFKGPLICLLPLWEALLGREFYQHIAFVQAFCLTKLKGVSEEGWLKFETHTSGYLGFYEAPTISTAIINIYIYIYIWLCMGT